MKPKPTLVQYYAEGWRTGYLVQRGYKWTRIRMILPLYSERKRTTIKVKTDNTREVQQ